MVSQVIYALLGGILPALVWLLFWLREDRKNPEPKRLIMRTFILGMIAVILVLPLQKGVEMLFAGGITILSLAVWAFLEEGLKLGAGYFGGLASREDNEPIDPMIYMITAALGFVSLENALFILGPMLGGDIATSIITGNLRFIGASLLHVVSSAIIGVSISFSFYSSKGVRLLAGILGLGLAIIFHTGFNVAIIKWDEMGTLYAFGTVWIAIVAMIFAFEKAKTLRAPNTKL